VILESGRRPLYLSVARYNSPSKMFVLGGVLFSPLRRALLWRNSEEEGIIVKYFALLHSYARGTHIGTAVIFFFVARAFRHTIDM
jgi:hypothetical protein